jgi:hypothetical protein
MKRGFVLLLLACLFLGATLVIAEDATTIINRSVAANEADWKAAPQYACFVKERNDDGAKTYEELMIEGSPYDRVVAINGKVLSAAEQAEQEQKLRKVIDERRHESKDARDRRISKYESERKRDHMMMSELTKAFNFTLVGKQKLDGHTVYALKATPRPGYQPPSMETKVLPGMQGRLWVDANDYQWVKVTAETVRPVSIEGFLARVEPGTRFELEKAPVEEGVWLPKHFAMRAHAKILYFINHKTQEDDTYFNCHKQSSFDKEEQLAANFHEPRAGE